MTNVSPIDELAKITKSQTELKVAKVFFDSVLTSSPVIDRSASWLLAGVGATAALIVANLEGTSSFIGRGPVSVVLWLLLIAGLFGLAQKYTAVLVQIQLHVDKKIKRGLQPVFDEHERKEGEIEELAKKHNLTVNTEIDLLNSIEEIRKIVPWYQRLRFKIKLEKSMKDPLYGQKHAARLYNRQVVYALAEVITTVGVIAVVATNI